MWDKLWEAIQKYGGSARDARIGAVGVDQIRDLYTSNKQEDKELAKELNDKYLSANVAGIALGATAASALTAGVVPTLVSEVGGAAGSYVGNKVGSYADEKFGTKWIAPTLSIVGGIGSGVGAYKGLKPSYNYLAKNGVIGYKDVPEVMLKLPITKENPVLNVGWAPKQTINIKRAGDLDTMYYPERWDVTNEGANPFGVWLQGKFGVPRTDLTNPGKGAKAAAARKIFASRKQYAGEVTLEKPIQTVGEIPNRSDLSYAAEKMGADGVIYNNVYDNGYNNNQVIFSFKKPNIERGYKFYEQPSKLSPAEKAGIPKHERRYLQDWTEWSQGGPISEKHLIEYAQIDNDLFRNKYKHSNWIDRRSIIQLNSKDAEKLNKTILYTGHEGKVDPKFDRILWTTKDPFSARLYADSDDNVLQIVIPKEAKIKTTDADKSHWAQLNNISGRKTNHFVAEAFHDGYPRVLTGQARNF